MTYAHVTDGTIDAIGNHPDLEWDGTRWWDLRDPTIRQSRGWYEVTETPATEPVEGGIWESIGITGVQLVDGLPVRAWTWRAWTVEELAAQADAAAQVDKIAAIEAAVLATVDRTPKPWRPVTGAHDAAAPLSEWTMDDGHTYRNTSGQWLSHSPYEYPRGYECLDCTEPEPDPDTGVPPWTDKGSPSYKAGDLRTWPDGSSTVYRCRQDHTAHEGAGYNPSVASLWEVAP